MRWIVILSAAIVALLGVHEVGRHTTIPRGHHERATRRTVSADNLRDGAAAQVRVVDKVTGAEVAVVLAWVHVSTWTLWPRPIQDSDTHEVPLLRIREGEPFDPTRHRTSPLVVPIPSRDRKDGPDEPARRVVVWAPGYRLTGLKPGATEVRLERAERGTLTVIDAQKRPVAGAAIWFYPFGTQLGLDSVPARKRLVTDGKGEATFERAGDSLLVRAPGFGDVYTNDAIDTVAMAAAFPFAGKVVDTAGAPIADAIVSVSNDVSNLFDQRTQATRTRGDGRFAFETWPYDHAGMYVCAEGYAGRGFTGRGGDIEFLCVLERVTWVSGIVLDVDGRPAPESLVTTDGWSSSPFGVWPTKEGRFLIGLGPGQRRVYASRGNLESGVQRGEVVVDVAEGERRTGLVLRLKPSDASTAELRVLGPGGKPMDGVRTHRIDDAFVPEGAIVNSWGECCLEDSLRPSDQARWFLCMPEELQPKGKTPNGVYRMQWPGALPSARFHMSAPGVLPEQVDVAPGLKGYEVRLRRGVEVSFVCEANVQLFGSCVPVEWGKVYRVDPNAVYRLVADGDQGSATIARWRPPRGGGAVSIKLTPKPAEEKAPPKHRVTGRVLDEFRAPLGGAAVRFGDGLRAVTRPDGVFAVEGVPGERLSVERRGYGSVRVHAEDGDVVLSREGFLRIRVIFPKQWRTYDWRFEFGRTLPAWWERRLIAASGAGSFRLVTVESVLDPNPWAGGLNPAGYIHDKRVSDHRVFRTLLPRAEGLVSALAPGLLHVKLWSSNFAMIKTVKIRSGQTSEVLFDVR